MLASNLERARFNMIEQQVRPCEVIDQRVLHTIASVPREQFVPDGYTGLAFADIHLPIGNGQQMMKPLQEARLLQALNVQSGDRVLEIGSGSGFLSACLADLGGQVTSYEIDETLSREAGERLAALGVQNVDLRVGNGLEAEGQFDAIAVTGSIPTYDPRLEKLLVPGGRLFVVIGEAPIMSATLVERTASGEIRRQELFETEVPALANAIEPEHFQF
jgi:protein-L-isoaspartate(D-aspartate) O-methyltransferase